MMIGFVFIMVGVIMLINVLFPEVNIDFHVIWPCLLVGYSIYNMIKNKVFDVVSVILFYIGFFYLVKNVLFPGIEIGQLFYPLLFILIGVLFVVDRFYNDSLRDKTAKTKDKNAVNYHAFFNEVNDVIEEELENINIEVAFGEVDLDLRKAKFKNKETIITAKVTFGNSNIILPEDVDVIINSYAFFGSNEVKKKNNDNKKKVIVNAHSTFGGVEIK